MNPFEISQLDYLCRINRIWSAQISHLNSAVSTDAEVRVFGESFAELSFRRLHCFRRNIHVVARKYGLQEERLSSLICSLCEHDSREDPSELEVDGAIRILETLMSETSTTPHLEQELSSLKSQFAAHVKLLQWRKEWCCFLWQCGLCWVVECAETEPYAARLDCIWAQLSQLFPQTGSFAAIC